jgi:hypothetical protein
VAKFGAATEKKIESRTRNINTPNTRFWRAFTPHVVSIVFTWFFLASGDFIQHPPLTPFFYFSSLYALLKVVT